MPDADRVEVACPSCQQRVAVARSSLGKKGRCPRCGQVFALEIPTAAESNRLVAESPLQPISAEPGIWDHFQAPAPLGGPAEDSPTLAAPEAQAYSGRMTTTAEDYLRRAREDHPTIQSQESEPIYRFTTSWGGVIGGAVTFLLGIMIFLTISLRLGIVMVIAGSGWFIQGLNYVFYYRWKDSQ